METQQDTEPSTIETPQEEVTMVSEEEQQNPTPSAKSSEDNMEKLREAALKRKLRRNASRQKSSTETEEVKKESDSKSDDVDPEELTKLREQLNTARLEMASMRRNHVTNVQKLTHERDMFAMQLSKEQEEVTPDSKRGMEELRNELKASKLRVKNMEEENVRMREELKELRLRVTAFKTLDAANSGYESVVNDLIHVKLKLATLSADNENLVHENRVLKSANDVLTTGNGLLEKSRTEWVHKCAELEKQLQSSNSDGFPQPPSRTADSRSEKSLSMNSDLQELAL